VHHRTQPRSVSAAHPIFSAIDVIAARWDSWACACSNTIRTARSRTCGENAPGLAMTPSSQDLEPPGNPASPGHEGEGLVGRLLGILERAPLDPEAGWTISLPARVKVESVRNKDTTELVPPG
jgi:hypothetical protein